MKQGNDDGSLFNCVVDTYFTLFISLLIFSIVAIGYSRIVLWLLAALCLLALGIVHFRRISPRLTRLASFLAKIPIRHSARAFVMFSLATNFWLIEEGRVWVWLGLVALIVGMGFILLQIQESVKLGAEDFIKRERQLSFLMVIGFLLIGIGVGMARDELGYYMMILTVCGFLLAIISVSLARKASKRTHIAAM